MAARLRSIRLFIVLLACLTLVLGALDAPGPALSLDRRSGIDASAGRLVKRRRHRKHGHRSRRTHRKSHGKSSHKSTVKASNAIQGQPIPRELRSFVRAAFKARKCEHQLDTEKGGFKASGGSPNPHYCGTSAKKPSAVCGQYGRDGTTNCPGNPDGQSQTAATFDSKFLDAATVPYVVISDIVSNQQSSFNFEDFGLKLLSPVTVICGGRMFSAGSFFVAKVQGDTNDLSQFGEGSIALAKACFPRDHITGNNAAPNQVLYIAHGGNAMDSLSPSRISADASRLIGKLNF